MWEHKCFCFGFNVWIILILLLKKIIISDEFSLFLMNGDDVREAEL